MKLTDIAKKGRRFLVREKEIAQMKWLDFTATSPEDIQAWEGVYDTFIPVKKKEYFFVKRNIALLEMPENFESYKTGKPMQAFRTNYNRGRKNGFSCHLFCGSDYIEQIMEINLSKAERAGKAMGDIYTDRDKVLAFLDKKPLMFGAFTLEGKLIGYLHLLFGGGMLALNKILGHGDYLEEGVMYFMLGELIRQIPNIYQGGGVRYIMYGSWDGGTASAGIQYYKARCGFCGYNVRYHIGLKRD